MITFPNAKINLGLNIVEKRPDGYHNLETIFYPIHIEDALEIGILNNTDTDFRLHVSGITVDGTPEDNLVVKAYRMLKQDFDLPPIEIYLYKHIPSGAGLGGGSADAAFMLKLLNNKFRLNIPINKLEEYAARLGADCAFFIQNTPTFAKGIGNVFENIELNLDSYHIAIVKPDIFVSTRDAFSLIKPSYPKISLKEIIKQPVETWKNDMMNDFEESVFSKYPAIGNIKQKLYDLGAIFASMSGSGSSVFGIFKEKINLKEHFCGCFVWVG